MRRSKYPFIILFLLPSVGTYVLFVVSPYLHAIWVSMTDWSGLTATQSFIGFDNFVRLWDDPQFWVAVRNNLRLLIIVPIATLLLGLFFASMLNVGSRRAGGIGGVRGSAVYKVVYFFPVVLSVAIVGVLFKYVFAPTEAGGMFNTVLSSVGLGSLAQPWLGDPRFALWSVLFVLVWSFVGFFVVLFSAAMQSIPREVYEAAHLDGADRLTMFRKITVPLVWDTVQVGWVYLAIQAMDAFALVHIMLGIGGGPSRAGDVLGVAMFRTAFQDFRFGLASAMGVVMLMITLVIILSFMRLTRRERVEMS